jgi:hypothetical protein
LEKPRLTNRTKIWNFFNSQSTYTSDKKLSAAGNGVYDDLDWKVARSTNNFFALPTPSSFADLYFSEPHQINAAMELMGCVDFTSVNYIGEIGGVPFRQLLTILAKNPHIKFLATDFDSVSLSTFENEFSKFKDLGLVSDVNKSTALEFNRIFLQGEFRPFDIITADIRLFSECDMIMLWGVDYALGDEELRKLLCFIKENKIKLILGSIKPRKFSKILMEGMKRNKVLRSLFRKENLYLRKHGYFRTRRYFKALAIEFELDLTTHFVSDWYEVHQFN